MELYDLMLEYKVIRVNPWMATRATASCQYAIVLIPCIIVFLFVLALGGLFLCHVNQISHVSDTFRPAGPPSGIS